MVASSFTELNPAISPDSRWLAYASNESGRNEIFVRPFPNTNDGRWQVSTGGGYQPRWAPDGTVLYFIEPSTGRLMVVPVSTSPTFAAGQTRTLFSTSGFTDRRIPYLVRTHPGRTAVPLHRPPAGHHHARPAALVRVDHWFRELEARMKQ